MGSGKTEYAIRMINESNKNQKFIYITPFLKEVKRIKTSVVGRKFYEPDVKLGNGSKYTHFQKLIAQGKNIVTTHVLFSKTNDELMELLKEENYILIIDEVFNIIEEIPTKKNSVDTLLRANLIEILPNCKVVWKESETYEDAYEDIRDYALAGNLYCVRNKTLVFNFPAKIFSVFEEVYVLTYMFNGQLQKAYYDMNNIEYKYYSINNKYELVPYSKEYDNRSKLKELIHVYEGNLNYDDNFNTLSWSWYKRQEKNQTIKIKQLKNNLLNYLTNIMKAKSKSILWTTFKEYKTKLSGKGYTNSFLESSARSSNEYKDRNVLAYCIGKYLHPTIEGFFIDNNIPLDEDMIALADMLQWIFRSAVRKGEPIQIYIPSNRMRELLNEWLDGNL